MILSVSSSPALVSGLMVVRAKNPVHSVSFPIPVFRDTSGLLLLLGLDFSAMISPVVHIGAIAVSFLFVVMMFHIQIAETHEEVLRYLPVSGIIGLILWWEMFFILDNETIPLLPTHRNTTSLRYTVHAGKHSENRAVSATKCPILRCLPFELDKLTFLCPRHVPFNPFREGNPCQDEKSPFLDSGNGTGSPKKGKGKGMTPRPGLVTLDPHKYDNLSFTRQGTGIILNLIKYVSVFTKEIRLIEAGKEGDEVAAALYDIGQIAKTSYYNVVEDSTRFHRGKNGRGPVVRRELIVHFAKLLLDKAGLWSCEAAKPTIDTPHLRFLLRFLS
ncbi:hypothetical protein Sjap_026618 [Stephania japonica]|uniref:NADH-ubiquinone oxidoreductase chain 6 n=1 Tax=Stephania japonica TaxID=461633 RepID=A0AAP0DUT9_9MAGN